MEKLTLIIALMLFGIIAKPQDTIVMKNGRTIIGKIQSTDENNYTIVSGNSASMIPKSTVKYIKNGARGKTLIINGMDINRLNLEYITISCYTTTMYGKSWAITFDIGNAYLDWKGHIYNDGSGNTIDFKSPMDAVNYVVKCGWEPVIQSGGRYGNSTSIYYLMKKVK